MTKGESPLRVRTLTYCSAVFLAVATFAVATGADPLGAVGIAGPIARLVWFVLILTYCVLLARARNRMDPQTTANWIDFASFVVGTVTAVCLLTVDALLMRESVNVETMRIVLAPHAMGAALAAAAIAAGLPAVGASPRATVETPRHYIQIALGSAIAGLAVYSLMRPVDQSMVSLRQLLVAWLVLAIPVGCLAQASLLAPVGLGTPTDRWLRRLATVGTLLLGVVIALL